MKQIFTMLALLFVGAQSFAQCTITGFDVCTGANPITSFTNATLISGTALTNGAKYKFNSITTGIGALDAIISIDGSSNATLYSFDDDAAADETGVARTQAALFSPKLSTNSNLVEAARTGYVQFTITFYTHYAANTLPATGVLPVPVANLNFLHFDMDGYKIGTNGYFREIGCVKMPSLNPGELINFGSVGSELTTGGIVNDGNNWMLTNGSTTERDGISRCAQVIEKTTYTLPQSSVTFRMGYEYKPASPYANQGQGMPQRQYGSKFGCFSLPSGAPLPVSLLSFAVNYNNGVSTINWKTSQEINLLKYEVMRSVDGINFHSIGSVSSRNILTERKNTYQDYNLPTGATTLYYKLKMIDNDGKYKISEIVTVKITNSKAKELTICPNPASTNAQLKFNTDKTGVASITVYDASGKIVLQQQAIVLSGNNSVAINNIISLADGMYTIKIIINNKSFSSKLIVWK